MQEKPTASPISKRLARLREEVRAQTDEQDRPEEWRWQDEALLYGDRDQHLFPQLQQHLSEAAALYQIQEQPFQSHIPLLGRLIVWFRERWNRVAAKWYVRPLIQQQVHFNAAVVRTLQDLHRFVQTSSRDLVHRMDVLFRIAEQEAATLSARQNDLAMALEEKWTQTVQKLRQEREESLVQAIAAFRQEREESLVQAIAAFRQEREQSVSERLTALSADLWRELARLEEQLQQVAHEQHLDHRGLTFLRMKLERLLRLLAATETAAPADRVEEERAGLSDHAYYRFEDLYRDEAEVREAQRIYLPYFEGRRNVLDLGCGKGEFLELLRAEGIEAYGVDLNEQMVRVCQEKGLQVEKAEALAHMAGLPDESLGGLFAAHLIEHLSEAALRELVRLAQAKLQPGACLAFETPNPLCLWALVNYFYLDMAHIKPVHPQAISFLLETYGFQEIEVRYLHPVPEGVRMALLPDAVGTDWQELTALLNTNFRRLNDLLFGHADYAVIARK